ncbi:MAG: hypothetical protein K0R03_1896 [Moraxellaceae bacterium]|jgi:uncharacterized protein (TIGR02117 family)|nr:hypothetical protein [Moraxellaceae bacterium]
MVLYFAAAWAGARIPVNADHRPVSSGIPVYLQTNGVHIDLVLPVSADCACGPGRAPVIALIEREFDAAVPREQWSWIAIGWGSAEFMLNVPTWDELTARVALRAVTGLEGSVLRLSRVREPAPADDTRRLLLSADEYRRLRDYIRRDAGAVPEERASRLAGPEDRFYRASSRYNLFNTCNEWVGKGLAEAGVRTPLWTPFDRPLLERTANAD